MLPGQSPNVGKHPFGFEHVGVTQAPVAALHVRHAPHAVAQQRPRWQTAPAKHSDDVVHDSAQFFLHVPVLSQLSLSAQP